MVETVGWIVIGIVGIAFAVVLAWLGMLWITMRTSKSMTEIFRTGAGREELEEIRRELVELRKSVEDLKRKLRR
jgi:hypothetical protein